MSASRAVCWTAVRQSPPTAFLGCPSLILILPSPDFVCVGVDDLDPHAVAQIDVPGQRHQLAFLKAADDLIIGRIGDADVNFPLLQCRLSDTQLAVLHY